MEPEMLAIATHLLCAAAAGGIIGLERSYHARPAGFRTHTLVCVASSLLMLVMLYQSLWLPGGEEEQFRTDPTRMAQGIMTGIGFLGAGVIFKEGLSVRGLTTAASIWMTAAIGILFGRAGDGADAARPLRISLDRKQDPYAYVCAPPTELRSRQCDVGAAAAQAAARPQLQRRQSQLPDQR
jgi:hypothetical protein